ncbi:DUF1905 domain-containing protein [Sphingobacterium sp. SRCM116780]|uniref:DUF1905 domain-containing protein n=1 Tax=Sphingobacterium sp. SRCM116780 TaxID=2907623 RepID=UPI001F3F4D78|nr:DUF1905 domain-containing protein [Sphingobacterium sp. SRCM116780]UIR54845.1 DUF1905 domain-containing protein [Sphingobacterium sp. SRCM116780]
MTDNNELLAFEATLEIIGINPFVFLPKPILTEILKRAEKDKGKIAVKGCINDHTNYRQTLLKYKGEWRLYINTTMLKNSPKRIGELLRILIGIDQEERIIPIHPKFKNALKENPLAEEVFNQLRPSLKLEIVKYISFLKTDSSVDRNVEKAINFLLGTGEFIGRKNLNSKSKQESE